MKTPFQQFIQSICIFLLLGGSTLMPLFGEDDAPGATSAPSKEMKNDYSHFPASPVPVPPGPFDLQICFELAVLRSETLGIKEEDVRVAQAQYWQAVGGLLPKVHLLTSERIQNSSGGATSASVSSGADNSSQIFGGSGGKDSFQSRINVKQPIFNGFREYYGAEAGKANIAARTHDKHRSYELLYLDVSDVFYQILMYEADLRILRDIQYTLQQRIKELEKRVKLGKSRTSELLAAKSDLTDSLATMEQVRGLLGASFELMSFLTGVPSSNLSLKDTQTPPSFEALEYYLKGSGERPDVLAAIETERANRKLLSSVKGERWPEISAEANYYLRQHPTSGLDWNVFLTCDLPLFEGGIIEARINEQKALTRSSQLSLEQLRRTADTDIRTAYNNFIASVAQVLRLNEAKKVADQNYEVQNEDYKLGVVANIDVLSALRQKYLTHQRLKDADLEMRANLIQLYVAAGQDQPALTHAKQGQKAELDEKQPAVADQPASKEGEDQ